MTAVMMDDDFMIDSDAEMSAIDEDFSDYDDDENVALPSVKKGSKPAAAAGGAKGKGKANTGAKKNAAKNNNNAGKKKGLAQRNTNTIDDDEDDDDEQVVVKPSSSSNKKTVEEQYQKMEQQEHILKRPDTYIGSTSPSEDEEMFIYDSNEDAIVKKKITYTPGLFKIFDESKFFDCGRCLVVSIS